MPQKSEGIANKSGCRELHRVVKVFYVDRTSKW